MDTKQAGIGEYLLITVCAFALPILGSIQALFSPAPPPVATSAHFAGMLVYECLVLAILGSVLWARGWRPAHLGLAPRRTDPVLGILLLAAIYVAYWLIASLAQQWGIEIRPMDEWMPIEKGFGLPLVLAVSLINAVFEEVFVCGYAITALSKIKAPWVAINASIAVRLAYHLYQGNLALMSILPMGFIAAVWFARTGRLWPLIVAHALMDFIGLYAFI